tara:strand:+ start:3123 stop:3563 length:441 start_codon:yes stop_codon:yes gene_type:complete
MKTFRELLENKENEYNNEGGMSKGQLKTMIDAAQELHDMLSDNDNMPEWVQSKITKATDYVDTARDYMKNEIKTESVNEKKSETWEAGYKRRVVKTTKPEHKEKGHNWRIKGKERPGISIKLYDKKPSQEQFNKEMKRVAGHEFGG